jgi:conjugal transfer pilus assembly protein TraB
MEFDGHVSYQGKGGVRGKPVMRNGMIVGYAGAAGLLSGFGEGIKSAATPSVGLGATAMLVPAMCLSRALAAEPVRRPTR